MNSRARVESAALKMLKDADVESPSVDVEAVADSCGIRTEYRILEDDISGCLIYSDSGAVIMAVNRLHHPNRQRFTAAHELGHFALHGNDAGLFVDNMMVHFRAGPANGDRREFEANTFAAALLMPVKFLEADLEEKPLDPFDEDAVARLARRYQVSPQALTIRLVQTGLVEGIHDDNRPVSKSRRRPVR